MVFSRSFIRFILFVLRGNNLMRIFLWIFTIFLIYSDLFLLRFKIIILLILLLTLWVIKALIVLLFILKIFIFIKVFLFQLFYLLLLLYFLSCNFIFWMILFRKFKLIIFRLDIRIHFNSFHGSLFNCVFFRFSSASVYCLIILLRKIVFSLYGFLFQIFFFKGW